MTFRFFPLPAAPRFIALWLAGGLVAPVAFAQFTPTAGGTYDYNTTANWSGGTINGNFTQTPAAAQSITFSANSPLTTGLTFALGGTPTVTLSGDGTDRTITLGGDVSVSGTTTSVVFGSTTPGNKLNVDLGGADRTVSVSTGNLLYVNNVISGANALTKTGAGQLTFAGANTYSGISTINGGTLLLNASGALNSAGNIVVNGTAAGATQLTLGAGFTQTIGALTFGGAGQSASATNVVFLNSGSTLTLGGTVTYNSTNNPTTQAKIDGTTGVLELGANRTFNVADATGNSSELNIYTAIQGSGFSLIKTGAGRLALNNNGGATYTGGTVLNAGELYLNASNTLPASGPITINDTAGANSTLILGTNFTQTIGALTLGGGAISSTSQNNIFLNTGSTLTLAGDVTYNATGNPGSANINGSGTLALGANRIFNIADSTGTTSEFNVFPPITGSGLSLTKTGTGLLVLSGTSSYNGGTILNGGSILLNVTDALAAAGSVTINNTSGATSTFTLGTNLTQTIGALTFGGTGGNTTSTNNISLNSGSTLTLGGTGNVTYNASGNPAAATISGAGTLALGSSRTFDVGDSASSLNEISISSVVSGGSLTKIGAGNLRLSGANTYTGGTTVMAGNLVVNSTSGSGVGTGNLLIQNGARLRGVGGLIGGATTIDGGGILGTGGTGATPGTLTFNAGLTLNDNAVFNFTLGTSSDKFVIANSSILTGATTPGSLTINLTAGAGFGANTYTLFDFTNGGTPVSFTVSDFVLGTTISGYTYNLALNGSTLQLTAIPEPSTYAAILAGASLLGVVVARRRRIVA